MGTVNKRDLSDYAKKGMSAKRIKSLVLKPRCSCRCRMPIKLLYQICLAFWSLCKQGQDTLLWEIQQSADHKKLQWYLAGLLAFWIQPSSPLVSHESLTPFKPHVIAMQDTHCAGMLGHSISVLANTDWGDADTHFKEGMADHSVVLVASLINEESTIVPKQRFCHHSRATQVHQHHLQ